ncbi:hypothetical protein GCM10009548_86860 [Streptomyces malaysiensis subsp. malaysiensis]|uniref:Type I polyketide synthase n=1 Tax=Streptomyces malaysiensis TaxID=92644 RepID=A0ABX6WJJ1_STRMQ|nr:type I polyketide synthase [Streptomyces solisilvae]
MSVLARAGERDAFAELSRFRTAFCGSLTARADAFFELTDALLCADGPTRTPVELSRSDRVLRLPKPPRVYDPKGGRPPEHGPEFRLAKPETWPEPAVVTMNDTPRYGKAEARAWDRVHPRLTHRWAWKKCSKPSAQFLGWAPRSVAIGASGGRSVWSARRKPVIPAGVSFDTPSSDIPLDGLNLQVVTGRGSWRGDRRVAGVSSFGLGGADCHVVVAARLPEVSAAPASPERTAVSGAVPLVVSGRTPAAVRAQAARLADWVDGHPGTDPVDLGGSLLSSRTLFDHRAVSLGADGLRALATGGAGDNVVTGRAAAAVGKTVFVFPGQGSQWVGMARELMDGSPVFAARMDECGQALEPFTNWRLADVLGDADALERTEVVQPVLWAVMVSLAAVWQSLGVVPGSREGRTGRMGDFLAELPAGKVKRPRVWLKFLPASPVTLFTCVFVVL